MGEPVDLSTWRGRMRAARTDLRLSSAALSRRLGKNDQWAAQVEKGHGSPDPETLAVLARELGRSVEWLITGEESGRSEFVDAMATYDARLQTRSKHMLLELAEREARLYPAIEDAFDLISRQMLAAGVDAETTQRVVQQARETALASGEWPGSGESGARVAG